MDKEKKIKVLQDLIKIQTINGNELAVSQYLSNLLQSYGISSQIETFKDDKSRSNLIVELGQGKNDKVLGLTGHQDTVAVTDLDSWHESPFSGTIIDDDIYGRGAADMKSGLAAEVISLIELVEKDQIPTGKVRLIITAGEEFGAPGAYLINHKDISDLNALIVGEATDANVTYGHSGSFNYRIKSFGKPVHSSIPKQGINAITGLVKYLNQEAQVFENLPIDDVLGEVQHSVTVINGGNQVNTIPGEATLLGNVRPTPSFKNEAVRNLIEKTIAEINKNTEYHLEFEVLHNFYPVLTDANSDFVKLVQNSSQKEFTDRKIKLYTDNAASDASVFVQTNPTMPVVILGPDKDGSAHQINEHTTISSYLKMIQVYQNIITDFFK